MTHIEKYNEFVSALQSRYDCLNQAKSQVDKEEEDILHFLEFEKYSGSTMMKITKRLKDVRRRRRIIKTEFEELQSILDKTKLKTIKAADKNKTYTYKTAILQDITDKKVIEHVVLED